MNLPAKIPPLSADDYLAGEPLSDIRHEYLAGEVYAMAGLGNGTAASQVTCSFTCVPQPAVPAAAPL